MGETMILEVGGKKVSDSPTEASVAYALRQLNGNGSSFAVLSRNETEYMQTAGDPESGYVLEWRDGEEQKHYYCAEKHLQVEDVIQVFTKFLQGDEAWKKEVLWDPLDLRGQSNYLTPKIIITVTTIALAILWLLL